MSISEQGRMMEQGSGRRNIDRLVNEGFVLETIGVPHDNDNFSFATWTRKEPGDYLNYYVEVANFLNPNSRLTVAVDDLISKSVFKRSDREQEEYNLAYRNYLDPEKANVVFTSELFPKNDLFLHFSQIGSRVSLRSFLQFLPEDKRDQFDKLNFGEIGHTMSHLLTLEYLSQLSDTLITGANTRAILVGHRNLSKNTPLSGILVPFFSDPSQQDDRLAILKKL